MNDTTRFGVRPEAERFVAAVRARFVDLDDEEREELLGGLEADVSELVADQGSAVLGDPVVYADELRSAAGLPQPARRRRFGTGGGLDLGAKLDAGRARWDGLVGREGVLPIWTVLATLQPAWWALRAWAVAVVVARLVPGWHIR